MLVPINKQLFKMAITLAEMYLDPTINFDPLSSIIYTVILASLVCKHLQGIYSNVEQVALTKSFSKCF